MIFIKNIIFACLVLIPLLFSAKMSYGAYISLKWTANSEADLDGYNIYYGTSSGNYGGPLDVGDVIEYELSGLTEGTTYYIALTAYDFYDNESGKSNEASGVAQSSPDTQSPTVTITLPTSASTYDTSNSTINIGGTASDNVGVTLVTWFNDRGGSGSASGTVNWSVSNINLAQGENVIAAIAADAAGNTGTDIITINYTPPTTSTTSSTPSSTTTTVVSTTTTSVNTTTSTLATTTTPVTTSIPTVTSSVLPTTTTTPLDNTPPSGTVTINEGDEVTYSTNVVLTLFATDDSEELAGDSMMIISNDNKDWSDPEPYKTTKMWILSSGQGEKTVYVKFMDAAGNWMENPVDDQITYEEQNACDDPYKIQPVSVTASSELFSKSNVIDGDPLTVWSTFPSFFWKNEFITLDLGEIKQISGFDMYAATNMFGIDYLPTNFHIEISMDNVNWEEITTEKSYNIQSDSANSWDFNTPEAQYIRVYVTKAKTFFIFHLVQIAEIEVYGCDISEQKLSATDHKDSNQVIKKTRNAPQEKIDESHPREPSAPGKPTVTFK